MRENINEPRLDFIIGYGEGYPNSHTCDLKFKNQLITALNLGGTLTYGGKANGVYAARSKHNLNQYYRLQNFDPDVQSMQIKIIYELRENEIIATQVAEYLANIIEEIVYMPDELFTEKFTEPQC